MREFFSDPTVQGYITSILVAVISILAGFIMRFFHVMAQKGIAAAEHEKNVGRLNIEKSIIANVERTICGVVMAVSQSYVETLKKTNAWNTETMEEARNRANKAVKLLLTEQAKEVLASNFGDTETFINTMIEFFVNRSKNQSSTPAVETP